MLYRDPEAAAPAMTEAFARAERILLLTHLNPDGDAIGSLLGMWHVFHRMGKSAVPLASSPLAHSMLHLPAIEQVQVYAPGMALPEADLVCMVDTAEPHRVGALYDDHAAALDTRPLVIIDHHVTNAGRGTINLVDPHSASCADLIYRLLQAMAVEITPDIATCLLMGVMSDTQSFQTSSTRPATLHATAGLLAAGADHQRITRDLYHAMPYNTTRLIGLSLSRLQREGEGALIWTCITQEMLRQSGADESASDEVVIMLQRVAGMRVCAMFRERQDGNVKISLRSTPGIDVAAIARLWDGGGHTQAAGATLMMDIAAAQDAVLPHLRRLLKEQ
jgi:phosphoesterase RecJ-like protein